MSLLVLAQNINRIAAHHENTQDHLRKSGELIAAVIRRNMDRRQVAGRYRPAGDTSGTPPGIPMQQLAAYTVAQRAKMGIHHDHQLRATGRTYREIGIRGLSSMRVTVGGTTARSRRLLRFNLGTAVTGELSTDLDRVVPPRNPVGYDERTLRNVWAIWRVPVGSHTALMGVSYRV